MVTHDLDSLHTVCDRIAVLANGKVVAAGPIPTMLACEHPWVKSYFRGRRSRAAQPRQTDGKTMETRAPYALIGLFVLAAVGAVFGFVYWLHNTGGLGEHRLPRPLREQCRGVADRGGGPL
jgi:ABC-type glutathione transport system ATPase component